MALKRCGLWEIDRQDVSQASRDSGTGKLTQPDA